ncbi:MAG: hypothetical protein JST28_13580 [Acidobacteria bacterium]|nr:hypothetical protein [Acidobacteriota bacterium]
MKIRAAVSPVMNKLKARAAFFAVAIVVTLGMLNARNINAQDASQVNIPFAFAANQKSFPAGHYRVIRESDNHLTVLSMESGVVSEFLVRTTRTLQPSGKNSLVFLRDERGYHLMTVRFGHGGTQTDLTVQPKTERDIAKTITGTSTEVGMN